MIQKIKRRLLLASTTIMLVFPVIATPALASAVTCSNISNSVTNGANSSLPSAGGSNISDCSASSGANINSLTDLARKVVTWFSVIVGAASVIMIIYGGFRYIISGGESSRVGAAKNSLIYAIVGLIIVALAQLIIHFVLNQTNQIGSS